MESTTTALSNGAPQIDGDSKISVRSLNFYYGKSKALHDVSIEVKRNHITALIGPSGCGKSTFLRTLNRMYELQRHTHVDGEARLDGEDIFRMAVSALRRRVGMVFQKTNPFPKSIFDLQTFVFDCQPHTPAVGAEPSFRIGGGQIVKN